MHTSCFECNRNQIRKLCRILSAGKDDEERLLAIAEDYQQNADMKKTNPEIMGEIWKRICPVIHDDNPYRRIKSRYNQLVLSLYEPIRQNILQNGFDYALKAAVTGNLIDFAAAHAFDEHSFLELLSRADRITPSIDDSALLSRAVCESSTMLYLGDNCGEIVLDRLLIEKMRDMNPRLHVWFGVRGAPVVNDVTEEDAREAGMQSAASVISSGDGSLGTVLERTSPEFRLLFESADLVVCKGQGNYEGLCHSRRNRLFFLFMAKCHVIADPLGIPVMSVVCMENRFSRQQQELQERQ